MQSRGPAFLWQKVGFWPRFIEIISVGDHNTEMKKDIKSKSSAVWRKLNSKLV